MFQRGTSAISFGLAVIANLDPGAVAQGQSAVDNDCFIAGQTFGKYVAAFLASQYLHSLYACHAFFNGEHEVSFLSRLNSFTRNRNHILVGAQDNPQIAQLTRPKEFVRIVEERMDSDRSGRRVDGVLYQLQLAGGRFGCTLRARLNLASAGVDRLADLRQ